MDLSYRTMCIEGPKLGVEYSVIASVKFLKILIFEFVFCR